MSIEDFQDTIVRELDLAGSDKISNHRYQLAYSAFLYGKSITSLLEIGIANGFRYGDSSVHAWNKIFPELDELWAIDIDPNRVKMVASSDIWAFVVDQSSRESLETFVEGTGIQELDLIIDDGSHIFEHAKTSFKVLFPLIKEGIYLIEDITKHDNGWQQTVEEWETYLKTIPDIRYDVVDTIPDSDDDSIVIGVWRL